MKKNWWRVTAGLFLVVAGIILLLVQLGQITLTGPLWGGLVLLAGSAFFLSLWFSNTVEWWPLIPGSIMFAWGVGSLLGACGLPGWLVVLVGFTGSALPFFYIFFKQGTREASWALIPGCIISAWGLGVVLAELGLHDAVLLLVGFVGSAVPFLVIFAMNRESNWWALIAGGIMALMGVVLSLGELVGGEWVAMFILLSIALAFLVVFIVNRRNWWALIPAGVLAVVGVGVSPLAASLHLIWAASLIGLGVFIILRAVLRRA